LREELGGVAFESPGEERGAATERNDDGCVHGVSIGDYGKLSKGRKEVPKVKVKS
jgi:hypothetical protein